MEIVVFEEVTCVAQDDVDVRSSREFCKRRGAEMREDDEEKGLLWRLPKLQTRDWGKMGPAFGYGIGCGVGLGVGIVGGNRGSPFVFGYGFLRNIVLRISVS